MASSQKKAAWIYWFVILNSSFDHLKLESDQLILLFILRIIHSYFSLTGQEGVYFYSHCLFDTYYIFICFTSYHKISSRFEYLISLFYHF
jgi:hypothetical protein